MYAPNTKIMIAAAAVITRAVRGDALDDGVAGCGRPRRCSSRMRDRRNTS